MQAHTLLEPASCIFPYGITTRDLSIFRSRKHPSPADSRGPHERKARTGCISRGVSKKSKSRKRHHSPSSRGPHDFQARAGFRSRDVLKDRIPRPCECGTVRKPAWALSLARNPWETEAPYGLFALRHELQQTQTHMHSRPARDCDENLSLVPKPPSHLSKTHTKYRLR
jgi:hypothetical protein